MSPSRMIRGSVTILFLMLGAVLSSPPQVQQSAAQTANEIKTEEAKFYADAHPYLDEPLPKLKKMVHELEGLKPAPGPEPLSDLLAKVGSKADELLQKVPDLISDEAVARTQWTEAQGIAAGCIGAGCLTPGSNSRSDEKFNYIILTHPAEGRRLLLEEYRATGKGKALPQGTGAPHFQGFVSAWVVFSSLNQVESRFRYLGQQKTHGHDTFVIGFAQIPGSIEYPGRFQTDKGSIPMLFQGIAWVDQSAFRIVRLRIDLLAPQPEMDLQSQTANILFGPVHIASLDSELWLPQAVEAEMRASGQLLQEEHQYSKYRLYQVKSRIVLNDARTPQYLSSDYQTAPGTGALIINVLTADTRVRLDRQAQLNLVSRGTQTSISQATDATSRAVFANLPYGSYAVEVSAVGYLSAHQELAVADSLHPLELEVVLQRDPSAVGLQPEPPKAAGLLPVISSAPPNAGPLPVASEPSNDKTPAAGVPNEAPFQLKATSNLVVVRVVVRDAQGKPVENLRKENFRLFDRGKAQTITQFEVETAGSSSSSSAAVRAPWQAPQAPPLPPPSANRRFMALYFDDLNTSDADLIEARDAADRYLATNLRANDRVAIVTSEEVLSDFTSDTKQIREALLKLHGSARALRKTHYCPDLSDYQALQITQDNAEAFEVASDEAAHCEGGALIPPGGLPGSGNSGSGSGSAGGLGTDSPGSGGGIAAVVIRALAQSIVAQTDIQARFNLQ